MSDKKELIINADDEKNKLIVETINQFKWVNEQLDKYKKLDKVIRESLKQYNFEKITILNNDETIVFSATQYEQNRKEFNKEKLLETLQAYICGDLELGDHIIEHSIPLEQELHDIIENAYETKKIKCVKYGVK